MDAVARLDALSVKSGVVLEKRFDACTAMRRRNLVSTRWSLGMPPVERGGAAWNGPFKKTG